MFIRRAHKIVKENAISELSKVKIGHLEQIDYDNQETIECVRALFPGEIINVNNRVVGKYKAVFSLKTRGGMKK